MGLDNDDIKQLIAILQRGLSSDNDSEEEEDEEVKPVKSKTVRSKKTTKKFKNKFLDMPEFDMHKSDSEFDQKRTTNTAITIL